MRYFAILPWLLATTAWAADNQSPSPCGVRGMVVNAVNGEPVKRANVTARLMAISDTSTTANTSITAITDEAGNFSLAAPEPGKYELVIQKRGFVQSGSVVSVTVGQIATGGITRLSPQGVIGGRVVDMAGEPLPGVTVEAIQVRFTRAVRRYSVSGNTTTNDLGEYRMFGLTPGRYYVGAAYRSESGYAAVYFPDVHEADRAVPIDLPPGGEVHGVNMSISEVHSVKIRGILQGMAGLAVRGTMIVAAPCDAGPLNRATTTVQNSDGMFELRDLTPGCYVLAADSFSGGKRFSARLAVNIAGKNIENVKLSLVPPLQVAGRVRTDGAGEFQFPQVAINLESRLSKVTASGAALEDGSLLLNNVVPEVYEVSSVLPDGYYLKSAKFGDTDVLRSGLDLSGGGVGRLELEISGAGGRLDGLVTGANEQPIEGAQVALISNGATNAAPLPKVTVTDRTGSFSIRGIAPGDYRVYAAQNLEPAGLEDAAYLKRLEPQSAAASIRDHSQETLRLRIAIADGK